MFESVKQKNIRTMGFYWTSLECKEGWYGVNCSQKCVGHCRDGNSCSHVTGQCDVGCAPGWAGSLCHEGINDSNL